MEPDGTLPSRGLTGERLQALVQSACDLLNEGAPDAAATMIHRLDKADTKGGVAPKPSIRNFMMRPPMLTPLLSAAFAAP